MLFTLCPLRPLFLHFDAFSLHFAFMLIFRRLPFHHFPSLITYRLLISSHFDFQRFAADAVYFSLRFSFFEF